MLSPRVEYSLSNDAPEEYSEMVVTRAEISTVAAIPMDSAQFISENMNAVLIIRAHMSIFIIGSFRFLKN
jgi:hypothetical protein